MSQETESLSSEHERQSEEEVEEEVEPKGEWSQKQREARMTSSLLCRRL